MEGRLFRLVAVGNQPTDDIDHEIDGTAMPRVLNLGDVLELVNDGFDNGAFAGEQLVGEPHQMVFHVASGLGKELDAIGFKESLCQGLGDIPSVSKHLTIEGFDQVFHGLTVVGIAGSELDVESLTLVIDHPMQFESKEPVHGGFASSRQASKHLVASNPTVMAHLKAGAVDEIEGA